MAYLPLANLQNTYRGNHLYTYFKNCFSILHGQIFTCQKRYSRGRSKNEINFFVLNLFCGKNILICYLLLKKQFNRNEHALDHEVLERLFNIKLILGY